MGRTRPKKAPASSKANNAQSQKDAPTPTIPALLEKAQSLIIQCDFDLAEKFVQRILEVQSSNAEAKEMMGVIKLEQGEIEAARQAFLSLIPPSPDALSPPPPSAHLYLAQLCDDEPRLALQHYQAAIEVLMLQLKGKERAIDEDSQDDELEIRSNIVRALIGQVEIWMDPQYDLCFEPEAEKTCEDLLSQALQVYPDNPEVLQTLASVRMSQQRPEEAKQCLERVWAAWKDLDLDDPKLPPLAVRLQLAKLFIELALYSPALIVLQGVMASDDQDVEAWYLEGWCFFLMMEHAQEKGGKFDDLTWEELAQDSRDCLETCAVLHQDQEHPDEPILEHANELISKLKALGIKPSPPDDRDDQGDWEDVDGSSDEDNDVEMS